MSSYHNSFELIPKQRLNQDVDFGWFTRSSEGHYSQFLFVCPISINGPLVIFAYLTSEMQPAN